MSWTGFIGVSPQGVIFSSAKRTITRAASDSTEPAAGVALVQPAASTLPSDQILVDVEADCGNFADAGSLISTMAGGDSVQVVGTLPVTNCIGLLDSYQTALYWLNYLAFQCFAWFMMRSAGPTLVSRQLHAADRTIAACSSSNGRRDLTQTRTDLVDVIDKIIVRYNRDYTKSKGPDAYNGATDIGGSGKRERPELFQFDHIISSADAVILRDLYLAFCKDRKQLIFSGNPIEQAPVESGDVVTLSYMGKTGFILPAEQAPGNFDQTDKINLTVLV